MVACLQMPVESGAPRMDPLRPHAEQLIAIVALALARADGREVVRAGDEWLAVSVALECARRELREAWRWYVRACRRACTSRDVLQRACGRSRVGYEPLILATRQIAKEARADALRAGETLDCWCEAIESLLVLRDERSGFPCFECGNVYRSVEFAARHACAGATKRTAATASR